MKQLVKYENINNNRFGETQCELAHQCPSCHMSLIPVILSGHLLEYTDEEDNELFLINYCPSCSSVFISYHSYDFEDGNYKFDRSAPKSHVEVSFSDQIKKLSPDFVSIYNESAYAESENLTHICGIGYRKALEFLIKDYSISLHPDKITAIQKMTLSNCINQYIEHDKIKILAQKSAWLGNDQTHYVQKHADRDVSDLKRLIDALVKYIDMELTVIDAESI